MLKVQRLFDVSKTDYVAIKYLLLFLRSVLSNAYCVLNESPFSVVMCLSRHVDSLTSAPVQTLGLLRKSGMNHNQGPKEVPTYLCEIR